jgi:pimeloyl-ACP methyl ester carboxylesterase
MSTKERSVSDSPTVVLVHGAFADASSWNGVIPLLEAQGLTVKAPPNPLRGVTHDSAYIAAVLAETPGPIVLVGHSYGGAVITNAATEQEHVEALVYVSAFVPDEGERLGEAAATSKDATLPPALVPGHYPGPDGSPAVEFSIDPARVHETFSADLSAEETALIAATQRPLAEAAFSDVNGVPAWRTRPAWAVIASGDKAVGTDLSRSMAQRAGARLTELDGSHVIMLSQPQAVTDVILQAVAAVGAPAAVGA